MGWPHARRPVPRQDGQPESIGPSPGSRDYLQARPVDGPRKDRNHRGPWLGQQDPRYGGEVVLVHGRAVAGRWRDGSGMWWEWGQEP